jgi:DNA repair protein RecO (recombination protein O)
MLSKSRAIVLHHVKYGDSSLILTLYSEKHGRITCIANSVRSKKARMRANLFQPLSLLEVDLDYRKTREIHRIKEVVHFIQYENIPFHTSKSTIALFISEVLYLTLREEEYNQGLFIFIIDALCLLDKLDKEIPNFHIWFMIQLTRFLGIFPGGQDREAKTVTDIELQPFNSMPDEAVQIFNILAENYIQPPENLIMSNNTRALILQEIIRYYGMHIEGFARLKSFSVLQEVYH